MFRMNGNFNCRQCVDGFFAFKYFFKTSEKQQHFNIVIRRCNRTQENINFIRLLPGWTRGFISCTDQCWESRRCDERVWNVRLFRHFSILFRWQMKMQQRSRQHTFHLQNAIYWVEDLRRFWIPLRDCTFCKDCSSYKKIYSAWDHNLK